ncbi:MAG TPA: CARDB domain-containing protein, partial [Nitrososphaera sp.]|nr:CARDB domain-containing protein [Nitrososphaera sp.]
SLSDLENKSFTAPGTSKRGTIKSTFTQEKNDGNRNAGGHWIRIYLSPDTTLSAGDKQVGKYFVSSLKEGKTKTFNVKATIPKSYPTGAEFYISFVDADNQIGEQDEFNNQRTDNTNIT